MNRKDYLLSRVYFDPNSGCWIWEGPDDYRYGTFYWPEKSNRKKGQISAHRASYIIFKGEIPPGLVVRHKCHTTLCVNPDHLQLGTQLDNGYDRAIKGTRHSNNRGLPRGVRFYANRFEAFYYKHGRRAPVYVGRFRSAEEASRAADAARLKYLLEEHPSCPTAVPAAARGRVAGHVPEGADLEPLLARMLAAGSLHPEGEEP